MIIAIDFDGTIVEHEYPAIGAPVPGALEAMRMLHAEGARLVLWTMRSGPALRDAVDYCTEQGVVFYGVNSNPTQRAWTDSPKAYAHVYVDDAAFGCPLIVPPDGRPYVDWRLVGSDLLDRQARENCAARAVTA